MKRRECITLFGGAALTWPLTAGMQRPAMPAVGLLTVANLPEWAKKSVCTGLAEAGYVEGRNLTIISRSVEGRFSRLSALAADLVTLRPAIAGQMSLAQSPAIAARPCNLADTGMFITAVDGVSAWEIHASEFCLTMAETPTMPAKIKLAVLGSARGPVANPLRGDARRLHVASSSTLLLDELVFLLMILRDSHGVGDNLSSCSLCSRLVLLGLTRCD
jgi:hypothetical protein